MEEKYDGDLVDGIRHGQGIETYANGNKYDGEWKDGKRHGQGIMTYVSGNKYVGEWKNGKKHDEGIFAKNKEIKNITESAQAINGKENSEDANNSRPSTGA